MPRVSHRCHSGTSPVCWGSPLGLLLFFSVQVFEGRLGQCQDEALSLVDVYETADLFPRRTCRPVAQGLGLPDAFGGDGLVDGGRGR